MTFYLLRKYQRVVEPNGVTLMQISTLIDHETREPLVYGPAEKPKEESLPHGRANELLLVKPRTEVEEVCPKVSITVEKINSTPLPDLSEIGYRHLVWELAQRAAAWHQQTEKEKNENPKVFNSFYRCVTAFGQRMIKGFKVIHD